MNTKRKKTLTILEFFIFLIIPTTVFLIIASKNKNEIEKKAVQNQTNTTISKEKTKEVNDLIQLGIKYMVQKKYNESIETNLKVLAINKNNKVVHNNLCYAYGEIGQLDNGIKHCNRAIELDSNFQLAKNNLQLLLKRKKAK